MPEAATHDQAQQACHMYFERELYCMYACLSIAPAFIQPSNVFIGILSTFCCTFLSLTGSPRSRVDVNAHLHIMSARCCEADFVSLF